MLPYIMLLIYRNNDT